jgi:hypothetical protein
MCTGESRESHTQTISPDLIVRTVPAIDRGFSSAIVFGRINLALSTASKVVAVVFPWHSFSVNESFMVSATTR